MVPEEDEKKKGYEKIFEEIIIVENFLNMEKETVNQVQEVQSIPYRINPRRNTPRHILIKLTKTKHTKNIKSSKRKATSNIQGKPHSLNRNPIHFQEKLCRPEGKVRIYLKY